MKKIFVLLLFSLQLSAFEWSLSAQAALFVADFDGSIKNYKSDINYRSDSNTTDGLGYSRVNLSYFESELITSKWYIPTLSISYMNIVESQNSDFNRTSHMIGVDFNGSVTSKTSYQVMNFKVYKAFLKKGDSFKIGKRKIYPGDIELDLGFTIKNMIYALKVTDKEKPKDTPINYIDVKQFVALPYLGLRYYYYNLILHADISTLGVGRVQASNYSYGAEYRVYKKIYLGVAYLNESFKAVEKEDTVTFSTSGTKFSMKYLF